VTPNKTNPDNTPNNTNPVVNPTVNPVNPSKDSSQTITPGASHPEIWPVIEYYLNSYGEQIVLICVLFCMLLFICCYCCRRNRKSQNEELFDDGSSIFTSATNSRAVSQQSSNLTSSEVTSRQSSFNRALSKVGYKPTRALNYSDASSFN